MHGGGGLLGFQFLRLHPGAGLRGDRRQLLGSRRDLPDTPANASDQGAQAEGHVLHGGQQLAHFVAAILRDVLAEIACGDALGECHGLAQRCDDQAGDQQRRAQAQHHCGSTHDAEHHQRALAVVEHALLGRRLGCFGQVHHRARTFDHGVLSGQVLLTQLLVIEEGTLIEGQRLQRGVNGAFLVVVEPYHQAASHGLQVFADVFPFFQRLSRTVDDVQAFMATQIKHAFAQTGCGFRQGQRIAAAQAVALQAQFTYRVVHVQLDHLELVARLGSGAAHVLPRFARLVLLLDIVVELLEVLGHGLLHGLIARAGARTVLRELFQQCLHLEQTGPHELGTLRGLLDGEAALQATRLKNLLVDLCQLADLGMSLQHRLYSEKAAAGHGCSEQQYQTEADE